jgi:outer membrane scaffolding protein for murein synthesis (MipA/OmpV family)
MCGVRSQEYPLKKEMVCILFPMNGAQRYVRHSFHTDMVSDHLHFLRSLQWYWQIIANRPKDEDNLTKLRDINDIQNGVFVGANVHRPFDARRLVILKVRCFFV